MKNTGMFLVVTLVVGASYVARGEDHSAHGDHHSAHGKDHQHKRDQLLAAVQKICPVSGQTLGDHGAPIKVVVGKNKEAIFLCCKGCLKKKIDPKHWGAMHANIARAQQICPVMKKKLPKSPKWTIVNGQIVYVCCPPCTKKIAAAPQKYLPTVDEHYAASLQAEKSRQ